MDRPARRRAQKARRAAAVAACHAHDAERAADCSTAARSMARSRPARGAATAGGDRAVHRRRRVGRCRLWMDPGSLRSRRARFARSRAGATLRPPTRRRTCAGLDVARMPEALRRELSALGCCSFTKAGRAVRHAVTRADRRPPLGPAGASRRRGDSGRSKRRASRNRATAGARRRTRPNAVSRASAAGSTSRDLRSRRISRQLPGGQVADPLHEVFREGAVGGGDQPQALIPHRAARQAHRDMIASALSGALQQGRGRSRGSYIAGDVVVDQSGRRHGGDAVGAFEHGEARVVRAREHVEAAAVEPRTAPAVAANAHDDDFGGGGARVLPARSRTSRSCGRESSRRYHVRGPRQLPANLVASRVAQIEKRRSVSDIGVLVDPVVLEIVVVIDREDIGALFRQRAADHRTGDGVGEAQHPDVAERPVRWALPLRFALADFPHRDHRLLRQIGALGMGQPFFGRSCDAQRMALRVGGVLQFLGVPPGDMQRRCWRD